MALTEQAYRAIKEKNTRMRLAVELGLSDAGIQKAIRTKSDSLTKFKALKAIAKLTGLKQSEIINQ
ncbi:hypothetical protein [Polynucleobacter sp.]|uniref:hypothetical protein n=1 Tax=Polynucleobacter sp. TaxID=2029855 RepID=UPI003F69CA89